VIELVGQLAAGDADLAGVDHDDVIARVDVRRISGLVLAAQARSELRCQATEGLVRRVDHVPIAAHRCRIGEDGSH
jgi:hypothetical protein